ncbi:NAD-dependent succinate-semialdehyde dehydrogenase [Helcobacillus massiliensis]|uniref:NAD-dependent succinate-semialdehyde dehydrogenase n=1 Tax=Helcobacillus massiliensis TaxID=521392 RepID=UPI0021A86D39|nr:NAD-dependent succinate-semialdehyde dehydrogenase [Helcobacillus massiliensis]MCT1556755.1 NAD-dependent succinate-semialdehyde dehydrogenase [Helcobacillus massiliensis]MCT2035579.1 NAD-dependent succinate-semialdehyde dehydrogenase [Helcobacillus massiliensis]MCT2330969.1 NAD-dependent succinate-semialdehyde dehydrogenase [Helcobacillus massiliensis]
MSADSKRPAVTEERIADLLGRIPTTSFVGGEFIEAGRTFPVENPATEETLVEVGDADAAEVGTAALDAAVAAQRDWAATAPRTRSDILRRAYDLLLERADDFALLMTLEMGKPLEEAYGEVTYGAEFFRWYSEEAVRLPGGYGRAPSADHTITVGMRPVGPVLAITPWNFPLSMGTRKVGPALAAGCTVVVKPAGLTPLSMLLLMQTLKDAGVPDGVVNCVVTKDSGALSSTLMADPRLRKVSFTGSTAVGKDLLKLAADGVLKSSMELGGNAPFLVLPSADIDTAVEAAMPAKFRNNGEACTAANRFYVHASVAEEFTRRFVEETKHLVVGPGVEDGTTMGPMVEAKAVDKIEELVQDAVDCGAAVLTGGARVDGPGHFFQPTVLGDVPRSARVNREEIFGPVAPIIVMDDVEEMIEAANDTEFGLMSYVIGEDPAEVDAVVQSIESGMLAINVGVASDAAAPFGGVKQSGLGREGSARGLEEYLEPFYMRRPVGR